MFIISLDQTIEFKGKGMNIYTAFIYLIIRIEYTDMSGKNIMYRHKGVNQSIDSAVNLSISYIKIIC